MAKIRLFIGGIQPLPDSGRPTGIYKKEVTTRLELGHEGFVDDRQADRRVHGGPEKAVHLYPAQHYSTLAEKFPEAARQLVPGSLGENISSPDLLESDIRIGDIWRLGSSRLQVCQPRNPCWKIDERFACEGMAAFIAHHRLTGWYWRVIEPGWVAPDAELLLVEPSPNLTLSAAMQLWHSHRPAVEELAALAASPGIALQWKQKIDQRVEWLRQNPQQISPSPTAFHVKPETP